MSNEIENQLAKIKSCPEPCDNGMVKISNISEPEQIIKMPCPVIALDCSYGKRMEQGLDRYVTGIMSGIGIPRRHLDNFMDELQIKAFAGIDKWLACGFLIFTGESGSGKSFGAALTIRKYLKSLVTNHFDCLTWETAERVGNSVLWCSAMDLCEDKETAKQAKRKYLIVIDDLGSETDTPSGQASLRNVILRRHDMKYPTVITTTLTMLGIEIRYGERVADRLTEDVGKGGMIIELGDVSIRNPAVLFSADRGLGKRK